MKTTAFNPYLPSWEYIPDGEPHVFGDRVYLYGSHDSFGASQFCTNPLVCWSAPVDDPGDWRYEGVIYDRLQDPLNAKGNMYIYAPDVAKGPDGRFYLYYTLNMETNTSVAVSDNPAGPFQFYGHVHFRDGHIWGKQRGDVNNFDPGVLVDNDGRVFLYTGFAPTGGLKFMMGMRGMLLGHAWCIELEQDMLTVKGEAKPVVPGIEAAKDTDFEGHPFFEASSIRHIGKKYYFVYSSLQGHELCYAISDRPDSGFHFGGVIISNGDIGYHGNTEARSYTGNNHGGLERIGDQWYIFYHRHTNGCKFSRQGCAEPVTILPDGSIPQVQTTSCGLNGGPLPGVGQYEARIACELSSAKGTTFYEGKQQKKQLLEHPRFTQSGGDREENPDQYIANLCHGSQCSFRFFDFDAAQPETMTLWVRGDAGSCAVFADGVNNAIARFSLPGSIDWKPCTAKLPKLTGVHELRFAFETGGSIDFNAFELN